MDVVHAAGLAAGEKGSGALWGLARDDLNVNVVRLEAGHELLNSVNADVDVLVVVIDGEGELVVDGEPVALRPGTLVYVPKGTARGWRAAEQPLVYVTAHRRRLGITVGRRPDPPARPGPGLPSS